MDSLEADAVGEAGRALIGGPGPLPDACRGRQGAGPPVAELCVAPVMNCEGTVVAAEPAAMGSGPTWTKCAGSSPAESRPVRRRFLDKVTSGRIPSVLMSLPGPFTLRRLDAIADDLHEVFQARGHRIEEALDTDSSFGCASERSRSSLQRDLLMETVKMRAGREGLAVLNHNGGIEIRVLDGTKVFHFRILKGARTTEGEWRIVTNSNSALVVDDEAQLFTDEHGVFSWTMTSDNQIDELVIARIVDFVEGNPGRLVLDQIRPLGTDSPTSGGFIPTDDDLPGFDEEDGFGEAPGSA